MKDSISSPAGKGGVADSPPRPSFSYHDGWQDNIPDALKDRDHWVLWRYELKDGRWTKIPYCAYDPLKRASTTDPQTWDTFAAAVAAHEKGLGTSRRADGIGYVFSHEGGLVGIDLDNCLADGEVMPWAQVYLDHIGSTYAEISPSGMGVKLVAQGELPGGGIKVSGLGPDGTGAVEMYDAARYFTITGAVPTWGGLKIEDRSRAVESLYLELRPAKSNGQPHEAGPPLAADDILLEKARAAKNGERFRKLFDEGELPKHDHSQADYVLCCHLAFWFNRDPEAVDRVFRKSALFREDKWDDKRGDTTYGARTVAKACEITEGTYKPGGATPDRARIEVTPLAHEVVKKAIAALRAHPDLYVKGDVLVEVSPETKDEIQLTGKTTLKGLMGAPRVHVVAEPVVRCFLTTVAEFLSWVKDKDGKLVLKPILPAGWIVRAVAQRKIWPGIRELLAVAECPYPRADGTIVDTPGYDSKTGTLYRSSITVQPGPTNPTKADARAAANKILSHFKDFPFATNEDRAALLAAILTAVARPGIMGPVPGFAIIGNKAGTGKGLLVDSVGIIVTGRVVPTSGYPEEKEEAAKVKVSIALADDPIVHFDNLEGGSSYGSGPLDSALTATTINERLLGTPHKTGPITLRVTWFLSGNNTHPGKDAYRRWLVINLVTTLEHPEERDDVKEKNLRAHLLEHRGAILRDVLTIFRAHVRAGRPGTGKGLMGSFELWDAMVRGAVVFATGLDPNATQKKAAEESPERQQKLSLIEGWKELDDGQKISGVTTAEAIKQATDNPDKHPTLHTALMEYGRGGKMVESGRLGNILRNLNANFGGWKFHRGDKTKKGYS